jgi:hypothetical protein
MGLPRRFWQKPNASSMALGILKTRALVAIRTTALKTRVDRAKRASLDTAPASQARQTPCCGTSLRKALMRTLVSGSII